jgi:hypothetical protein
MMPDVRDLAGLSGKSCDLKPDLSIPVVSHISMCVNSLAYLAHTTLVGDQSLQKWQILARTEACHQVKRGVRSFAGDLDKPVQGVACYPRVSGKGWGTSALPSGRR